MVDVIIVMILTAILGAAIFYIVKAKKSGARCIGCSAAGSCPYGNEAGNGCSCGKNEKIQ